MTWVYNASPELDAQSNWPLIIGVCTGLTTLMTITVGLRIYVRAWMIKSMGTDDWVMLSSCVFFRTKSITRKIADTIYRFAVSSTMASASPNLDTGSDCRYPSVRWPIYTNTQKSILLDGPSTWPASQASK